MRVVKRKSNIALWIATVCALSACAHSLTRDVPTDPAVAQASGSDFDDAIKKNTNALTDTGREVFRYETFGSEAFWGDTLQLHKAIVGAKQGGVGAGLTPKEALKAGLKVDIAKLPSILGNAIKETAVSLDNPETTVALLRADSVIGVKAFFGKDGTMQSIGIQCSLCHSTVDDSFANGIGRRLDGWPNRDLNVGAIVALAPNLKAVADALGTQEVEVRRVLAAWGPGKYDAHLNLDKKGFRPDGKSAAVVIPAAFGLAGQNLSTYTGWGSVPYWNAYVAKTQMHGGGAFRDARIGKAPPTVTAPRTEPDPLASKLAALHVYQLTLPAPKPPKDSYDASAAERGKVVFNTKSRCSQCHVPPLFSEPGWALHKGEEIGIDNFQADRSPERGYRTTPLAGLFTRAKGGYYHDGRFATLPDVVRHYEKTLNFQLSEAETRDLVEYLKSL